MFRIRTVLAGAAVAVAATLLIAAPASAHDQIVASSPSADEQLTTAPDQIELTFSGNLLVLADNSGTAMTVVDENGQDWVAGEPVIAADTVTTPLKPGMPNGEYVVTWKVVSSDGHPTSGDYSFSIAAEQSSPAPTDSTAPTESTAPVAPVGSETPSESAPADSAPWPLLIGLGVVVLIAIVLVIVFAVRRKR